MPTGGGGGGVTSATNAQMNSLGVGIAPDGTTGDALIAGAIATGGNSDVGATAGDVLVARAAGANGVLNIGGSHASSKAQLQTNVDAAANIDLLCLISGTESFRVGNVYNKLRSGLTFSNLPAAAASYEGALASITDSTTAVWGATITGGGANHVLAYCDGAAWKVAGI